MDKKLVNLYDKNDDPMMWELREIKIKMSKEGIDFKKINQSADDALKKYGIKLKTIEHSLVSDKKETYNSRKPKSNTKK